MTPSCSRYADLQFKSNNFVKAFLNTSDRLIRCSHDINYYEVTKESSYFKFIDYGNDSLNNQNKEKWFKGISVFNDTIKNQENLIQFLIKNEHYSEALLEINRAVFNSSHAKFDKELFVNYIRVLRKLNLQERVQLDYESKLPDSLKNDHEILFEIGLSWLELNNIQKSHYYFEKILHQKTNITSNAYQQSLIYLSYIEAKKNNFKKSIELNNLIDERLAFTRFKNSNNQTLKELLDFKPKSQSLGLTLGIIPGFGYLYAGHSKSAFSSLIINSLLVFATYSTFKSNNNGLGTLLALTSLGFYFGNIKGGKMAVERHNNTFYEKKYQKLYPNFSL